MATAVLLLIAAIINAVLFTPAQAEICRTGNDFDPSPKCAASITEGARNYMLLLKTPSGADELSLTAGRVLTDHSRMSERKESRKSFTNRPSPCPEKPSV